MKQRKLGNQGLVVSELGLGCMGMSEFYGIADESEAIATIHRALELGVTLLDTADMYGVVDTPLPKGEGILASSVLPRIISNPLFGYVHKHTRTARPRLE